MLNINNQITQYITQALKTLTPQNPIFATTDERFNQPIDHQNTITNTTNSNVHNISENLENYVDQAYETQKQLDYDDDSTYTDTLPETREETLTPETTTTSTTLNPETTTNQPHTPPPTPQHIHQAYEYETTAQTTEQQPGQTQLSAAAPGGAGGITIEQLHLEQELKQKELAEQIANKMNETTDAYNYAVDDYNQKLEQYYRDLEAYYASTSSGGAGMLTGGGTTGTMIGNPVAQSVLDVTQVDYTRPASAPLSQDEMMAVINSAMDACGITDPNARGKWAAVVMYMTQHESGHNPAAANGWDSNAVGSVQLDGYPGQSSRGLMQTIPTTFAAYHVTGTSNCIYDPVANVSAAMNYMMNRYGISPHGAGLDEFYAKRFPTYMGY